MASMYWPGILAAQQQQAHVELRPTVLYRSLVVLKVRQQFSLKGASDRGEHAWTSQTNAGSQLIQNGSPVNLLRIFLEELVW